MARSARARVQTIGNRNIRERNSIACTPPPAYERLKVPYPEPTDDVCPECRLPATMWPLRSWFREHVVRKLCQPTIVEVDFDVHLDPEDLARDRAENKEKKIAR